MTPIEQLVEAGAAALAKVDAKHGWELQTISGLDWACHCGVDGLTKAGLLRHLAVETARELLLAMLSTETSMECGECEGNGVYAGKWNARTMHHELTTCLACHGSGTVPGSRLMLGEQTGTLGQSLYRDVTEEAQG